MLLLPIGVVASTLLVLGVLAAVRRRPGHPSDRPDRPDVPARLLASAARLLSGHRHEWGRAMVAELAYLPPGRERWHFALGTVRVVLFPPGARTGVRLAGASLVSGVALAAGLTAHALLPQMQVFTVAFVLLAGGCATLALTGPRPRPPSGRRPAFGAAVLLGVAGVIAFAVYAAAAYPAAAADPTHAFSIVLAAVLAGYLWLALTPPRPVRIAGPAPWYGVAAVAASLPLWLVDALARHSPTWFTAGVWLGTSVLIGVAAVLAGRRTGTVLAGLQAGLSAGLVGGLLLFTGGMTATLAMVRRPPTDPALLADVHRSHLPDAATYLVSDNLGGLISMLVLVPIWTVLLGTLAAAVAASRTAPPAGGHALVGGLPRSD